MTGLEVLITGAVLLGLWVGGSVVLFAYAVKTAKRDPNDKWECKGE